MENQVITGKRIKVVQKEGLFVNRIVNRNTMIFFNKLIPFIICLMLLNYKAIKKESPSKELEG